MAETQRETERTQRDATPAPKPEEQELRPLNPAAGVFYTDEKIANPADAPTGVGGPGETEPPKAA